MNEQCFHIARSDSQARIWATFRVPFEPKTAEEFRLRDAVRSLLDEPAMRPHGDLQSRHVIYAGPAEQGCDVENVACYNMGRWNDISPQEPMLRLERAATVPDSVMPLSGRPALHYWHYAVETAAGGFGVWTPTETDAFAVRVDMDTCDALSDAKRVWYAVKNAISSSTSELGGLKWLSKAEFGICVRVILPNGAGRVRKIAVKSVLDGILAALHQHQGPNANDDLLLLAEKIGKPFKEIGELGTMKKGALLGPHRVFIQRARSVQVSPRDDRCVAAEVRCVMSEQNRLSVQFGVFDVSSK